MKKLFLFGALFAVGLSFTACSSDNDVASEGAVKNHSNGQRYIALSIVLPNDLAGTRAANDNFKNGLASEFAVNSVKVFVFESNATSAVLQEVLTPDLGSWTNNANGSNVTTRQAFVSRLTKSYSTPYVLAVVNDNGLVYTVGTTTYADILSATTSSYTTTVSGSQYFTMTNSPLSSKIGGSTDPASPDVNILVAATTYETEAEANAATPSEIYVERIAAKVTVQNNGASTTSVSTSQDSQSGTILWWTIDNTEPSAYFVRNVSTKVKGYFSYLNSHVSSDSYKYRFIGASAISSQYRIYWAEDPNYSNDLTGALTGYTTTKNGLGDSNPMYCLENTFDLAHQVFNHTTRVVLAVQFNSGTDFYVINGATGTLYDNAGMTSQIQTAIVNDALIQDAINHHNLSPVTLNSSDVTVSFNAVNAKGVVSVNSITLPTAVVEKLDLDGDSDHDTDDETAIATLLGTVASNINTSNVVEFYDDGKAYYTIRIKHFGDDLTPWSTTYNTGGGIYDVDNSGTITSADETEYLGRYGVVRNNWYNINVSSIKRIGSPVVTSVSGDTTTDDTVDQYIAYAINILAWAYRNQDENL